MPRVVIEKERSGGVLCEGSDETYKKVLSQVKVKCEDSKECAVKVGIYQG